MLTEVKQVETISSPIRILRELYRYRELLWTWILREVKVRYKQSFLGAAWAILQPLVLMLMFTLVFSLLVRIPSDDFPYPVFSYTAVLPWTFFATSISLGSPSLINNLSLVTKTYFPREILPIGTIGASFLDYLIASTIFIVMLAYYRIPFTATMLWVPLILLLQIILTFGVVLLAASISVHFRDVRFLVPLGLQVWFYATPVIYPVGLVPVWFRPIYMLNPMAVFIDSYRRVILHGELPAFQNLATAAVIVIVIAALGYWTFKRLEVSFADVI